MLEILQISTTADTKGLHIGNSGAVTTGSGIGYGLWSQKTGASTTNVAGYFTATGATNNYAGIFDQGNVGIGTTAPVSTLDINGSFASAITSISSATTLTGAHSTVIATPPAAGSNYNITLPTAGATNARRIYTIVCNGSNAGTITITPTAGNIFYDGTGSATFILNSGTVKLQSDGTNWYLISPSASYSVPVTSFYATNNNAGIEMAYPVITTADAGWTTASASSYIALADGTIAGYFSPSPQTVYNLNLIGWVANSAASAANATIYIMKYSVGTAAVPWANTLAGTSLGSQAVTLDNSLKMYYVNIKAGNVTLAAGDIIICWILNAASGAARTFYFNGQLQFKTIVQ